jgi:hypothetical protein
MAREAFPLVQRCILSGSIHQLDVTQLERIRPCGVMPKPWTRDDVSRLVRGLDEALLE